MRTLVTAARLVSGNTFIDFPVLVIEDGILISVFSRDSASLPTADRHFDYPDAILAPAFYDVHTHGAMGHDLMEATSESLDAVSGFLATHGVGSFLATTVTAPVDSILRSLDGLAELMKREQSGAQPLGLHLEGPFLSHKKRGVHPPEDLQAADIALFDRFYEAAQGTIRLMTLAPELEGALELAKHATAKGVRVTIGHSDATAAETEPFLDTNIASSATHTFNAMRPLDHREPGILGKVLTTDSLYAELICDGIHVDPTLVRLWWRMKGRERGILVTDSMAAAGMPDGDYMLGNFAVEVKNGVAMANGVLAGSVLTLDRALKNFVAFTGVSLDDAVPLLTANPAAMTGFADRAGSLSIGGSANLVVLGADGALQATILRGQVI